MWLTNPVSCWTYCKDTMSFKPVTQRLSRIPFISVHSEYILIAAKITLLCSLTFWPAFVEFIQHSLIQSTLWLRMQMSLRGVIYLGFTISVLTSALQMTLYTRSGGLMLIMKRGYGLNSMCWQQAIALGWTMTEHSEGMPVEAPPCDIVLILVGNIHELYSWYNVLPLWDRFKLVI